MNKTIADYILANSIDPVNDVLLIEPASLSSYKKINRNVLLGLSSQPLGLTDSQSPTNKTFDNTNAYTIKDGSLTLQNSSDTTKQGVFSLSGNTTGTTRTYTLPDRSSTIATLGGNQTFTGTNSFTGSSWTGGTIDNATVTVDTIAGHTTSNTGTVYGISISSGVLTTANSVSGVALTNSSVTSSKLSTGAQSNTVATSQTTTSVSYTDLATVGPAVTVTIGANGLAWLSIGATQSNSGANSQFMGFAVSGANTISPTDASCDEHDGGTVQGMHTFSTLITGLAAGSTTFTAKYRTSGGTATYINRVISVVPL